MNDEIEKIGEDMANLTTRPSKIGDPFANFKFPPKTAPGTTGEFPFPNLDEGTVVSPTMLSPSLMPPLSPTRKSPSRKDRDRHSTPPISAHSTGSPYPAPLSPTKRPSIVSAHASFPPPTPTSTKASSVADLPPEVTAQLSAMQGRIGDLENRIPKLISNLTNKNEEIRKDLSNLLETEQYRVKELDQLYREAVAENELLYERFGSELGKIVKAVRAKETTSSKDSEGRPTSKDGSERKSDLVEKVQETTKEMATVKSENARLKREVIGLKTVLKGNGIHYHSSSSEKSSSISGRGGNVKGIEGSGSGLGLGLSDSVGSNGTGGRLDSSLSASGSGSGRERAGTKGEENK